MVFIPYQETIIETNLNPSTIQNRLEEITWISKNSFWSYLKASFSSKRFIGKIGPKQFEIIRLIRYGNSSLPVIYGEIEKNEKGSSVFIKMKMKTINFYGWLIWMILAFIILLMTLPNVILSIVSNKFDNMLLIPFYLLIFGYLIAILPFNYEVYRGLVIIRRILK